MNDHPTFETTIYDYIEVNGRISKKLFEKIVIPRLNKVKDLEQKLKIAFEALNDHRCICEDYNKYECHLCEALKKIKGEEK